MCMCVCVCVCVSVSVPVGIFFGGVLDFFFFLSRCVYEQTGMILAIVLPSLKANTQMMGAHHPFPFQGRGRVKKKGGGTKFPIGHLIDRLSINCFPPKASLP